jgi:titin
MRNEMRRVASLSYWALLLLGCADPPLSPDEERASLSAEGSLTAPSNLIATPVSATRINLAWLDRSSRETGFELRRSTTGATGTFALLTRTAANVTAYSNISLSPLTQYCYKVRAFRTIGNNTSYSTLSPPSCASTLVAPGAPPAPTATTAKSTGSAAVVIAWTDNSADETGFRVERAPGTSGPWSVAASAGPDQSSAVDDGRASETQVCYRVAAVNAIGRSNWSEVACTIPPAAPTNLHATGSITTTVALTWSDNSAAEDGYEIQRATAQGGPYLVIADLSSNATAFHEEGLASDQTYWYKVRAKRAGGFSDAAGPSAGVTATTLPAAPTWLSASPMNGTWTDIIWRDNSTNEEGYRFERSEAGGPWVTLGSGGEPHTGGESLWRDKAFPIETEICYRIVAFNSFGESSVIGCTALPAVPVDLTAKVVDGVVELSWTDISKFEDGYYIMRAAPDEVSMGFYIVYDAVGPNVTTYRDPSLYPHGASYYLRGIKGPEGYSCCSNSVEPTFE